MHGFKYYWIVSGVSSSGYSMYFNFLFTYLLGTPIVITSSAIVLKVFAITEQLESISQ